MKYGILLNGEEARYLIYQCETIEELRENFAVRVKALGFGKVVPIKFLTVNINLDDGLDDAVIGGVER